MIRNYSLAALCLFFTACAGTPLGKFDSGSLTSDRRLVFGKITFPDQTKSHTTEVCFTDVNQKVHCGVLATSDGYIKYDQEKPYYNYVTIALPPGPTKISWMKIHIGNGWHTVQFTEGLDFMVDRNTSVTYFGDVSVLDKSAAPNISTVTNNYEATARHLKSINPSFPWNNHSISLASPLKKYEAQQTLIRTMYIPSY